MEDCNKYKKINYRPDIDGLRAVAILSVLFYHLDVSFFGGGFLGVDIFFVISGFLITRLIKREVEENGSFSFKDFYIRRFRRLFPALIVVLLLTSIIAIFGMSPTHLERFGGALTTSLLSVSNVYFFKEVDYFGIQANFKPLLHLWSISIEEQFYLIWPLALWLLLKPINKQLKTVVFIVLFLVLSLYLNGVFQGGYKFTNDNLIFLNKYVANGHSTIFYLLPFRIYEFMVGALVVFIVSYRRSNISELSHNLIFLLGLFLIGGSIISFDENTKFSLYRALAPVFGTAMLIYSGENSRISFILKNKLMVSIGLISYSLYLFHWPIIVFYDYFSMDTIKDFDNVLYIVAISMVFSVLSYKYIEQPFRKKAIWCRGGKKYKYGSFLIFILLLFSGISMYNNGWNWRVEANINDDVKNTNDFHREYYGGRGYPYVGKVYANAIGADVVVLGDSHARHYMKGLDQLLVKPRNLNLYISSTSCIVLPSFTRTTVGRDWDKLCSDTLSSGLKRIHESDNPLVIVSASWLSQMAIADIVNAKGTRKREKITVEHIITGINKLKDKIGDSQLVVIGMVPGSDYNVYEFLSRPNTFFTQLANDPKKSILKKTRKKFNSKLRDILSNNRGITFLDPHDVLCKDDLCRNFDSNNNIIYSDINHLSKSGSIEVINGFLPILEKLTYKTK
jgi:peptidoglycan/LPS O-acetylase OafA/YrhL